MFKPADLLGAYREARSKLNTSDIVLAASDQVEGIQYMRRLEYAFRHLRRVFGPRASEFGLWHRSAQSVMKLPPESDAMWLIVELEGADTPIMCVIFAVPYETGDHVEAPTIGAN
jgi:hypothetical protein